MFLRSLELFGFKSFATRTTLEFQPGVTAIVGPNGCGKSNVLDAIRWVLGEQSAKALRGSEMADVIFSGTESRSALSMAEVSMTFADCRKDLKVEWDEISITRRIYRDGKSDYFINRTLCRLRDIQELFMDTGIGRSAYSIMEQGKIDQILSSKPEERRAVFEEAAGITRFKTQKREALRKLELTDANLLRVNDILAEVRRQIKSLERQAAKARNYRHLSDTLRILETHFEFNRYSNLNQKICSLEQQIQSIEGLRAELNTTIHSKEGEILSFQSQIQTLDEQLGSLRNEAQQTENAIFAARNRIESHQQRISEIEAQIQRNEIEISQAQALLSENQTRLQETEKLLDQLLHNLIINQSQFKEAEIVYKNTCAERIETERLLATLDASASQRQSQAANLQATISSAQAQHQAAKSRLTSLQEELTQTESSTSQFAEQLNSLRQRIQVTDQEISSLRDEIAVLTASLNQLQEQSKQLATQRRNAETQITELETKLNLYQQIESTGQGYDKATQILLRGQVEPPLQPDSVLGTLASFLNVQPNFVPAIEAALGPTLQTVLFNSFSASLQAAHSLQQKSLGRAYLYTSPPSNTFPSPHVQQLPAGAIAWAIDVIEAPSHLQPLLSSLLYHIAIAADLSTAHQLHKNYPHLGFATLDGFYLAPNGILIAGTTPQVATSTLLRKHEISNLQSLLATAQNALSQILSSETSLSSQSETTLKTLESYRSQLNQLLLERTSLQQQITTLEHLSSESAARSNALQREQAALLATIEETRATIQQAESSLSSLLSQQQYTTQNRASLEAKLSHLRQLELSQSETLNQLRLQIATEKQQNESLLREQKPLQARLQQLSNLISSRQTENLSLQNKISFLKEEISSLQLSLHSQNERLSSIQKTAHNLLDQRFALNQKLAETENLLRNSNKKLAETQDNLAQLQIQITQLQLHRKNHADHIFRRYQINLESFQPDYSQLFTALHLTPASHQPHDPSTIPWQSVEEKVAELSQRLDSLGPVNLDAIQEYEELQQRLNFLEQQFQDLTNSKKQLLEIINRINNTTKRMFAETFEKIRKNFQEMFSQLFGGGKATLELLDSSDPLESGIEIIAKPPGKKLQNISLLSGGERTMTAVALLFAIYMVKPSPFCVLDEMDAPLDESNIRRFIEILDRFVNQSQFLVITHNKRTISRADVIYGVTMEEQGVSKIVSVNFRNKTSTPTTANNDESPGIAESLTQQSLPLKPAPAS